MKFRDISNTRAPVRPSDTLVTKLSKMSVLTITNITDFLSLALINSQFMKERKNAYFRVSISKSVICGKKGNSFQVGSICSSYRPLLEFHKTCRECWFSGHSLGPEQFIYRSLFINELRDSLLKRFVEVIEKHRMTTHY